MSEINNRTGFYYQKVKSLASSIYSHTNKNKAIGIFNRDDHDLILVKIYTVSNEYTINVKVMPDEVFMFGQVTSRVRRPGETWNRGNFLPDGHDLDKTWGKIMEAIVKYESQDLKSEKWIQECSGLLVDPKDLPESSKQQKTPGMQDLARDIDYSQRLYYKWFDGNPVRMVKDPDQSWPMFSDTADIICDSGKTKLIKNRWGNMDHKELLEELD